MGAYDVLRESSLGNLIKEGGKQDREGERSKKVCGLKLSLTLPDPKDALECHIIEWSFSGMKGPSVCALMSAN